jgi:hypothetical protein
VDHVEDHAQSKPAEEDVTPKKPEVKAVKKTAEKQAAAK